MKKKSCKPVRKDVHPVTALIENAKPRLEDRDGVNCVILHDIERFLFHLHYSGTTFCLKHDVFEEYLLRFTPDDLRRAKFSLNKGTSGPWLRIETLENGKPFYYFAAEKFEDVQALAGCELTFEE
jgi:hypothetical protein